MKDANDLLPWKVTDISFRPHRHFWSFNASIHFDGTIWRCVLRCCDYCMAGGVTTRSKKAQGGVRTKNAMVIFDPRNWRPLEIYKMKERDPAPRGSSDNVGYEDIRLFWTEKGGLQGIAASQHLARARRSSNPLPEQVVLSFDEAYDIIDARPIRNGFWDALPQKNWAPFDGCEEPRFLYAIDHGTLFDERGVVETAASQVRSSPRKKSRSFGMRSGPGLERARERAHACEDERDDRADEIRRQSRRSDLPALKALVMPKGIGNLRGGTQLVCVDADAWLGIGHDMRLVDGRKIYWHVWYTVDSRGALKSASEPMKLAPQNGIEFAAGMAIDGDRVVVSFGVDDHECKIGETTLSAVLAMLKPVGLS